MASMGASYLDPAPLIRTVKHGGYINKLLQNICVGEGLSKLGVKAELQNRIVESMYSHPCHSLTSSPPSYHGVSRE